MLLSAKHETVADGLEQINDDQQQQLSIPLQLLYAINGMSQTLPSTALMYIVNTRVAIPIEYLPVYGALAFLPFSLKPLYAHLSTQCFPSSSRTSLLAILLILGGGATVLMAFTKTVISCIGLAILRGVTAAWPEFLLDLCLMDQAHYSSNYMNAAAKFQSQAATCRNAGSLGGNIAAFLVFLVKPIINERLVTSLLLVTGSMNLVGAGLVWHQQVGAMAPGQVNNIGVQVHDTSERSVCFASHDTLSIIILQLCILLFALQSLMSSPLALFMAVLMFVLPTVNIFFTTWTKTRRVAAFLIFKHAMPGSAYVMSSFLYNIFQSSPYILQGLGLTNNIIATISSWSYGRFLAKYSSGVRLRQVLAGTLVLAALVGLLDIILTRLTKDHIWQALVVVVMVKTVTSMIGEWAFLPSVVLATTSVTFPISECELVPNEDEAVVDGDDNDDERVTHSSSYQQQLSSIPCCPQSSNTAMQYGTFISCIDLGDQIGSWLTVPLVAALGITRENGWEHLDVLIVITAALSVLPLVLLPILKDE